MGTALRHLPLALSILAVSCGGGSQGYTVSGTITGIGSSGAVVAIPAVQVVLTTVQAARGNPSTPNRTEIVTTASDGTFTFTGLTQGTYQIGATSSRFLFNPPQEEVEVGNQNVSGLVFDARDLSLIFVSGAIDGLIGRAASVTV